MCSCVCLCMFELEVDIECLLSLSTLPLRQVFESGACQTGWPSSLRDLTASIFQELGLWFHIAEFDSICGFWGL